MRVLLTTRGSAGHLLPLVPFGHACREAGHEVLVAAQRGRKDDVERTGLPFAPTDDPPQDEWMPLMGQFAELDLETADRVMIGEFFAGIDVRAGLPGLDAIVGDWRPDVILRESWEFASTVVAERCEIPIVRVGLGVARMEELSIEIAAPVLDRARRAAGLPADPNGDRLRQTPYLTMLPEALDEPGPSPPWRTQRFRGSVPGQAPPMPDWWPGDERPLVYLTLGSVAAGAHMPYFPALYRAAIDLLAPLPARVLVTVGDRARDLEELGPLPPNVRVEQWVAQDAVAPHATVMICHGGYGSTLGALAHGVPLVVLPLFSGDQWANAAAVARAGVGLALDADRTTRRVLGLPGAEVLDELPGAVRRALDDAAYAHRARAVADDARAQPPIEDAVTAIRALVRPG